jgi:hypothetical protein
MKSLAFELFNTLGLGVNGVILSPKAFEYNLNKYTGNHFNFVLNSCTSKVYVYQGNDKSTSKPISLRYTVRDKGVIKKLEILDR